MFGSTTSPSSKSMKRRFRTSAVSPRSAVLAAASCINSCQRITSCANGAAPVEAGATTNTALKACADTRAAADGLLDDFEDGDTKVSDFDGRDGYFFTSKDPKGSTIG